MIDISYEKNPELYDDYKASLEFLSSINYEDYSYPDEEIIFHVYTEIQNEKEIECVKSYLATQNLEKTKLIIWSDYDISNNELIKPYLDYVTLKVFDPIEESKGTPFEDDISQYFIQDTKYYLKSDFLRLLVLYKYGGIWFDMDVVLLRDFKPILDQEYMYQWGRSLDFSGIGSDIYRRGTCGTVLSLKKKSDLSYKMLTQIKKMPILPNTAIWGKDLFSLVYREMPFTVFPVSFFNIEWELDLVDPETTEKIGDGFEINIDENNEFLFLDCFAWHWHNSSRKNKKIIEGSKFDLLRKRTNYLLEKKQIL